MSWHPKVDTVASIVCKFNAEVSKNECLGIGSALEKKSESDFD